MRIPVVIAAAAGLLMSACAQDEPTAGAATAKLEPSFYDPIRKRFPDYFDQINTKVMAACIDWRKSTPSKGAVRLVYWYYTGRGSRGSVWSSQLRQSALYTCNNYRRDRNADCECDIVAHGNNFILEPSAEQLALLGAAYRSPPTTIRMFTGTGTWEGEEEKLEAGAMLVDRENKGTLNLTLGDDVCEGTYVPAKLDAAEITWSVYCPRIGPVSGTASPRKDGALSAVGKNVRGRLISLDLRSEL